MERCEEMEKGREENGEGKKEREERVEGLESLG